MLPNLLYRKFHMENGILIWFRINTNLSTMCLYNIITQTQPQPCPLPGRFGGKKRLKDFFPDFRRNSHSIILNAYPYFITKAFCGNGYRWFKSCNVLFASFRYAKKCII